MVKKTLVYLTIPSYPYFGPFLLPFSVKKAMKEIKVKKRYDAAGFFTARRMLLRGYYQLRLTLDFGHYGPQRG